MRVSNSIQQTVDWEMLGEADVEKDDDVGEKNRGDLGKGASAGLDIHLPTAAAADSSAMSVKEKDKKNRNCKAEHTGGQMKIGMKPLPSEAAIGKEDKMTWLLMWLPEPDFRWPISSW
ncbi:hypothetical protein HPP92_024662 [Vanilla planifolia]|uniref:Uncharacterized protein n=1 Tax=Vanilla planifolia TaxID=51239 RepID=A0A835PNX0_VANPL|nr:hypothetical protein HPP92_024662 [Vanilla planifolia]